MARKMSQPGLKDVAARAGVGYATASRALSGRGYVAEKTRQKVEQAAEELGYMPNLIAKALREDRTNLVGVILPNLINEFYSDATQVIQEGLTAAGLQMLVIAADDAAAQDKAVAELVEHKVAGIIQVPVKGAKPTRAVPVVQLNRAELPGVPAVLCDDELGFAELSSLVDGVSAQVAAILGDAALSTTQARLAGIQQVFPEVNCTFGNYTAASGYEQCKELFSANIRPEVLIVTSPRLMAGVIKYLREKELRVPQDLVLVGYDDPEWYQLFASGITTFSPDHEEMGRKVIAQLLSMVNGEEVGPTALKIPGEVISRGSHLKNFAGFSSTED